MHLLVILLVDRRSCLKCVLQLGVRSWSVYCWGGLHTGWQLHKLRPVLTNQSCVGVCCRCCCRHKALCSAAFAYRLQLAHAFAPFGKRRQEIKPPGLCEGCRVWVLQAGLVVATISWCQMVKWMAEWLAASQAAWVCSLAVPLIGNRGRSAVWTAACCTMGVRCKQRMQHDSIAVPSISVGAATGGSQELLRRQHSCCLIAESNKRVSRRHACIY